MNIHEYQAKPRCRRPPDRPALSTPAAAPFPRRNARLIRGSLRWDCSLRGAVANARRRPRRFQIRTRRRRAS